MCLVVDSVGLLKLYKTHSAQILSGRYFANIQSDNVSNCTFVCEHDNPTPAHKAIVTTKEKKVSVVQEIFKGVATVTNVFDNTDFTCVTSGMVVPLDAFLKVAGKENDPTKIIKIAQEMAVSVDGEPSKNSIMKQIIERKLGDAFTITNKILAKRQGDFSPYSRSRHGLCIQHKTHHFKEGAITASIVTSSEACLEEVVEGDVITSVMEFKTGYFVRDQTLAEMMCTLTDCSIEVLRDGKQIKKAVAYGLSVDYNMAKVVVYKMVMNFADPSFKIYVLENEMTLHDALNVLISVLASN